MAVFPNIGQAFGDTLVLNGEDVAAFADDNTGGLDAYGFGGRFFAGHKPVQQGRPAVAEDGQVGVHAGDGCAHGIGGEEITLGADDGDFLGDLDADAFAGFEDVERLLVV